MAHRVSTPPPPSRRRRPPRTGKARPPHPGEVEQIAARRAKALELRKAGGSYRAIAAACGVDVATAWNDVHAELAELRTRTVLTAEELRELELARLDRYLAKLEAKGIAQGDPRAINTAVGISKQRARLLGLEQRPDLNTVPVEQVFAFVRSVTALVLEIVTDRQQATRFVAGIRQLVGRGDIIQTHATPTADD